MRIIGAVLLLGCLFMVASCATVALDATTVQQHSVAMNQAGQRPYTVLSDFTIKDRAGWVIGIVPVNLPAGDNHDYLATLLQNEITKAGGDAVINVKIKAQQNPGDFLINIATLGVYVTRTVTVTGQVIKYK